MPICLTAALKSPEKNRNEIRNSMRMPQNRDKLWRNIKQMAYKSLNIVKTLVHLLRIGLTVDLH